MRARARRHLSGGGGAKKARETERSPKAQPMPRCAPTLRAHSLDNAQAMHFVAVFARFLSPAELAIVRERCERCGKWKIVEWGATAAPAALPVRLLMPARIARQQCGTAGAL